MSDNMWLFGQTGFTWDHGLAIGILSSLFLGVGWIVKRVFGDGGAMDKAIDRMGAFFDGLLARMDKQLSLCDGHGKIMVGLDREFDASEKFETVHTNKSLADLARVELIKLHGREGLDDGERIEIITLLSAVVERLDPIGINEGE